MKPIRKFSDIIKNAEPINAVNVYPASIDDIGWIAQLESELFTGKDVIPVEQLLEWYKINQTGFFIFKTEDGKRIGHIDILPLRPQIIKSILAGELIEREIKGIYLYTPNEKNLIKNLYIECVAIKPTGRIRAIALQSFLSNFSSMVSNICPVDNIEKIFAVAATKQGEQFMKNFGFTVAQEEDKRKDGHKLFVGDMKTLLLRIPDQS
ncbi:MAG: hypothetical protein C4539_00355 [Ignavibacteriales bacterium]|nr:MAG: hypothetical protein C4539_00355 [Ignavibacteriales bacterium]